MERHKKYSWFKNAMIKCENNALEINSIDEMFDVYLDYCNPIEHSMNLEDKNKKLQAQLEKAEKVIEFYAGFERPSLGKKAREYFKDK